MSNQDLLEREETGVYDNDQSNWYKSNSPEQVNNLEKSFKSPTAKDGDLSEGRPGGTANNNKSSSKPSVKGLAKIGNKKKFIIGLLIGVIFGGSFAMISVFQGPLQLLHLSQILGNADRPTVSAMRIRKGAMMRYSNTGDAGELRVSRIGSQIFNNARAQLSAIGVDFTRGASGRPTAFTINTSAHPSFRDLGDVSDSQRASAIARHYGISPSRVTGSGGTLTVNMQGLGSGAIRTLTDTNLRALENGKIMNGITKRTFAKFFNTPSMFRPIQRTSATAQANLDTTAGRITHEVQRRENRRPNLPPRYSSALSSIRQQTSGFRTAVSSALIIQGAICTVHNVASLIPLANYAMIVSPSIDRATDMKAVGSQIESGRDTDPQQIGAIVESFTMDADQAIADIGEDNLDDDEIDLYNFWDGRSIWSGEALQATESGLAGQGEPITPDFEQAFNVTSTSDSFRNSFCSTGAQVGGAILGVGLLFFGGGTGNVTLRVFISQVSRVGGSVIRGVGAGMLINHIALGYIQSNLRTVFSGPQGGNLLAYGARASNNLNATTMGGVQLSEAQSNQLIAYEIAEEQHRFAQKSFIDRTFNPSDYRSLTARIARSGTGSLNSDISNVARVAMNPFNFVARGFSGLSTKVFAEGEPYDWGEFPVFGIPPEILENERFENPYQNEAIFVDLLDNKKEAIELLRLDDEGNLDPELEDEEIESLNVLISYVSGLETRAAVCFGVDFSYRPGDGWTAIREEHVNPAEDPYQNLKRDNRECERLESPNREDANGSGARGVSISTSNNDWTRLLLFVFDSSIATALDCYEGGTQSCQDLGIGGGSSTPTSGGSSAIAGDPNGSSIDQSCPEGTRDLGTETSAWSDGVEIPTRLCEIKEWTDEGGSSGQVPGSGNGVVVNANVAGAWLSLYEAAQADGVSLKVTSSFRTYERQEELCGPQGRRGCAPPGRSNHQSGHAIDFSSIYSQVGGAVGPRGECQTARGNADWEWLVDNASRFGFGQLPIEAWHWDADYDGGCI